MLDASAALRVVLVQPQADSLADRLDDAALVLAPDLYVAEVGNSLSKYVVSGQLDPEQAGSALDSCLGLVDVFVGAGTLVTEALTLASRHRHPVYDLLYAVLARRHGTRVLTVDRRFSGLLGDLDLLEPTG